MSVKQNYRSIIFEDANSSIGIYREDNGCITISSSTLVHSRTDNSYDVEFHLFLTEKQTKQLLEWAKNLT